MFQRQQGLVSGGFAQPDREPAHLAAEFTGDRKQVWRFAAGNFTSRIALELIASTKVSAPVWFCIKTTGLKLLERACALAGTVPTPILR